MLHYELFFLPDLYLDYGLDLRDRCDLGAYASQITIDMAFFDLNLAFFTFLDRVSHGDLFDHAQIFTKHYTASLKLFDSCCTCALS